MDRCPVCDGADFYGRKDFDPKVGLTVVIIGALISAVFYWFGRDLIAYSILAGAALIDLVVYGRLKDLTVCYRCHTEFRGAIHPRTAPAFDLHTADVLEQEYERRIGRTALIRVAKIEREFARTASITRLIPDYPIQKSVTSTSAPSSTTLWSAGISM